MSCDQQQFIGVTREKFTSLAQKVQQQTGIAIVGDSGTASDKGFTLSWAYQDDKQLLTIQCADKPFFVPCSMVQDQIAKLVQG